MNKRVTVFGGSQAKPGEPAYQEAVQLGFLLGNAGYTVMTGGYIGMMEAVSRGAAEAGGHVIGVTCDEIEAWRPEGPNRWVKEEWRFTSLRERMFALIDGCDAALAMPGGPGTLAEISLTWNQLITGTLTPRPLILVGSGWQLTIQSFYLSLGDYIPDAQRGWLTFRPDARSAFEALEKFV